MFLALLHIEQHGTTFKTTYPMLLSTLSIPLYRKGAIEFLVTFLLEGGAPQ